MQECEYMRYYKKLANVENFNLTMCGCGFISCLAALKLLQQIILTTNTCLISLHETVAFSYKVHVAGVGRCFGD